jgi:hypothetical protein
MTAIESARKMVIAVWAVTVGISFCPSESLAQSMQMQPLPQAVFQAISLGRSSGQNYPVHVAVIDARNNGPISISFPNLRCDGILLNDGFPDAQRFRRWPVLRDYKGLTQFRIELRNGRCPIDGFVVLHNGTGGNCINCDRQRRMTYFYFGRDGHASGSQLQESPQAIRMSPEDAEDLIDRERVQ